jgi:hypothetical protein
LQILSIELESLQGCLVVAKQRSSLLVSSFKRIADYVEAMNPSVIDGPSRACEKE